MSKFEIKSQKTGEVLGTIEKSIPVEMPPLSALLALVGAVVGAVIGFNHGGIGGALLGVVVGALALAIAWGLLVAMLPILAVGGAVLLAFWLISKLWGVGLDAPAKPEAAAASVDAPSPPADLSKVQLTIRNRSCSAQDLRIDGRVVATVPSNASKVIQGDPGNYRLANCRAGTESCVPSFPVSWAAGAAEHYTIYPLDC